jgi:heptosyltransferase-1
LRVLIVKVSSLGDIIHTLPAVTDAHRARRDLTFDWVVEENFVEVPSWHPAVDKVIPVAFRRWRKSLLKTYMNREFRAFRRLLQSEHYDLVIDAQGLIKSGVISRISKGLTVGLSNRTIREPLATLFYNKMYSVPWTEHAVDRVRQLFSRALKYNYNPEQIDYGIRLPQLAQRAADDRPSIVFLHGTTWVTKHWPEYYWRHLAQLASSSGYRVLLPWGDDKEKARAEFIAAGIDATEVLPRLSLSELAGQINEADGVIGVDTGLGHLAAALAKPTVTLYGPTNPGLSGTFGHNQLHLNSTLNCAPCIKKVCAYNGPGVTDEFDGTPFPVVPACFASHRPELVWQQFQQLVSK